MTNRTCLLDGCATPPIARGYCSSHYAKERKAGRLAPLPVIPHDVLFWSKVNKEDDPNGCWIWMGWRKPAGYGIFSTNRYGHRFAHRAAWEFSVGAIPDGYEVDHLCRVTSCVNPAHLEPVTPRENRQRAVPFRDLTKPRKSSGKPRKVPPLKPMCGKGHPFDEENTAYYPDGKRRCRTCHRENERARLRAKREAES